MRLPTVYLIYVFLLFASAFVVFRIFVRRDYRHKGRLTLFSSSLQLLIWGLYFSFPCLYNPCSWPRFWFQDPRVDPLLRIAGVTLIGLGLVVLVTAMAGLGLDRSLGRKVNVLRQAGFYRVSRNPQIVGSAPIIIGLAVLRPSWYALGWVVLFAAIAHTMVLTEEEHLRRVHGEDYARYCLRVPRYLGLPRR